jgi:hypothetical protein
MLAETKVPDSTPGLISLYALNDEQALLARLRYNRLIDIFTGISCYSLQSHLRTALPSFENNSKGIKVVSERHYKLVLPEEVTPELLSSYKDRLPEG